MEKPAPFVQATNWEETFVTYLKATLSTAALMVGMAGVAGAETKIDWWGWAPAIETANEYIAAFEAENPDVKVNFRSIPYADYVQALRLGVVSNAGPDVFNLEPGVIAAQFSQFAQDIEPVLEDALGTDWRSKMSAAGVADFTVDGVVTAAPVQVGAAGQVWYNNDLKEEIGFEVPTTLDEWLAACEKVEAAGKTCFVHGAKDAWVNLDFYIGIAQSVAPGKVIDAINGKIAWTDPDLVQAFEIWQSLFSNGLMQEGALGVSQYPDARNSFIGGDAAFILMGTWHANNMGERKMIETQQSAGLEAAPFTQIAIKLPDMAGKGNPSNLYGGADYGLAISKKTDAEDAAAAFVKFLSASESGAGLVAENTFPPALTSVAFKVPDYVNEELQAKTAQDITNALANIEAPRQIPFPDVKQALSDALSAVAAGVQEPAEAAEAVEAVSAKADR